MYQDRIRQALKKIKCEEVDPRHIEGYMRLEHGTLDNLSAKAFDEEVYICSECVKYDGQDNAESLAITYCL